MIYPPTHLPNHQPTHDSDLHLYLHVLMQMPQSSTWSTFIKNYQYQLMEFGLGNMFLHVYTLLSSKLFLHCLLPTFSTKGKWRERKLPSFRPKAFEPKKIYLLVVVNLLLLPTTTGVLQTSRCHHQYCTITAITALQYYPFHPKPLSSALISDHH